MTQAPKTWAAKDPSAVLDYVYRIALDPGDSISSKGDTTFTVESGDVSIDSYDIATVPDTNADGIYGQDVTAWLSGGADGEIAMFKLSWTTVDTREDDAIILLPVVAAETAALVLTGYAKPQPAHLIIKYPAFADVSPATVQFWLTDAERFVTDVWSEGDYAAGLMALAAHNMALAGYGADGSALSGIPAGVTGIKSGALDITLTKEAANARITGDYSTTRYGAEFAMLLQRNRGGPYVAPSGVPIDCLVAPPAPFGWFS